MSFLRLYDMVGNKSDSRGKYYSSPVQPSCSSQNDISHSMTHSELTKHLYLHEIDTKLFKTNFDNV